MPASKTKAGASFTPGSLVGGKYLVERVIGEGGLGAVVAAKHMHLDQMVAIKYLHAHVLESQNVVERFAREARLAGKIQSEHVARVHDVGKLDDGSPYMVMEFLEGRSLANVLDDGPLPVDQAIDCILQACEALAEAHALGIVHRDLKPANLFLARRPGGAMILKLLDFGISKMPDTLQGSSWNRKKLTSATDKFGTPDYMSPEQLNATASVDARADIWALGVVLYELLTGKRPFHGDSLPLLFAAIVAQTPAPMLAARPDLPPGLCDLVVRCLAKERDDRFRNVGELVQELAAFAAPASRGRADLITRVIREGGQSIRPPTPFPGTIRAVQVPAPAQPTAGDLTAASESRPVLAPEPPQPPSPPLLTMPPGPRHRGVVFGGLAVVVALATLVVVVLQGGGCARSAAAPALSSPAVLRATMPHAAASPAGSVHARQRQ